MVKAFLASVSSGLGAKPVGETSAKYEAEEVQVDGQATVKPIFLKTEGGTSQVDFEKSLSLS